MKISMQVFHVCTCFTALITSIDFVVGDFTYPDFNQTLGLVFNGNASTTACNKSQPFLSKPTTPEEKQKSKISVINLEGHDATQETVTNEGGSEDESPSDLKPQFGHRDVFKSSPKTGCSRRLRLTSSSPSQAGSVFYQKRVSVIRGFDTTFSFQITDHSRVCTTHVDPMVFQKTYKSCALHGGDGFAFVIHSDEAGTSAIGGDGQEMGYGGIRNSLAVEFDMWTNVNTEGSNDLFADHISIHSASTGINTSKSSTMIGNWRPVDLADGQEHTVRVQYLPYVEEKYIDSLTANDLLLPYLKDNGEGRRLGTLAVFIDEGIQKNKPILAIPLNLSILLDLPQSLAYIGFTASTGLKWENHDILRWQFHSR